MLTIDDNYLRLAFPTWRYDFVTKPNVVERVLWGGRGSGKTTTFARYVALITSLNPDEYFLCAREYQSSIEMSVYRAVCKAIYEMGLTHLWKTNKVGLESVSGSRINYIGLARNVGNLQGLEGITGCWIDEAQHVSHESMNMLLPTLDRTEDPCPLLLSFNPYYPSDWCSRYKEKDFPEDVLIRETHYNDNEFFTRGQERRRQHWLATDPDTYQWAYEGKYLTEVGGGAWVKKTEWEAVTDRDISFDEPDTRWFIGVDGSINDDLTSICYLGVQTDRIICKWRIYICDDMMRANSQRDYSMWVRAKYMEVVGTDVIDQEPIKRQLESDIRELKPELVCFDNFETRQIQSYLKNLGPDYARSVTSVGQTAAVLDQPMRLLRSRVRNKSLWHDGNPVAQWAMLNVEPEYTTIPVGTKEVEGRKITTYEDRMLVKPTKLGLISGNKIDPIAALLDAIYGAEVMPKRNRGFRVFNPETSKMERLDGTTS